jgi:hypothetical protein
MKNATLLKVTEGGQVLILSDRRALRTCDATATSHWAPSTDLEIKDSPTDDGLLVTYLGVPAECISARWTQLTDDDLAALDESLVAHNAFQQHVKLLRAASTSSLPSHISRDNTEFSYSALRELHDAGMITGTPYDPLDNINPSILNPQISLAGREYLAELEQAVPNQTSDPAANPPNENKDWHETFWGKVWVGVIIAVFSLFAVFLVKHYLGAP